MAGLSKALADEICDGYKYIGDYIFEVNPHRPTTTMFASVATTEDWALRIYALYAPDANTFSIALVYGNQHIRRFDSDSHKDIEPHIHWFVSEEDPQMHLDVRTVPSTFQDTESFEKTLRDFFRYCNITFGDIRLVEAPHFELE